MGITHIKEAMNLLKVSPEPLARIPVPWVNTETGETGVAYMTKGVGPTRASTFPESASGRKAHPVASGVLDYFPDAIVAISGVSFQGNEQHHPGKPLHWDRTKSSDEGDALLRHFLQRGELDSDGIRHTAKMAWRALAMLQKEIENAG